MAEPQRLPDGKWAKGASGNPDGRSSRLRELEKLIQIRYGEDAIKVMGRIRQIALESDDEDVALKACVAFLDRLLGKPKAPKPEEDEDPSKLTDDALVDRLLENPTVAAKLESRLSVLKGGRE